MAVEWEGEIDPQLVRFTHSKIRPYFSGCGRRVEDTIEDIVQGKLRVDDLPKICILTDPDGNYYSLNNRRLYVFKQLRSSGLLENQEPPNMIRVRFKQALPRELKKYSVNTCSLNCSIMHERCRESKDCSNEMIISGTTTESSKIEQLEQGEINFETLIQSLPQNVRDEVKKAVKLQQQGKSKNCLVLLSKLEQRKLISKESYDQILDYVMSSL